MNCMYIWREVQGYPGFTDLMVLYRNVLVHEINFVLSPRFANINESQKAARDYEAIKNNRILIQKQIIENAKRNQVELSLIEEPLRFTQDTATAEIFLKYFQLSMETIGRDIYYAMRQPGSPYLKVIEKKEFSKAIEFFKFFPKEDADNEFVSLFTTASKQEVNKTLYFFLELFHEERYKALLKHDDMKKALESEYERAESEKRLDDAGKIAELMDDKELHFRLKTLEALLSNDAITAINYLQKIKNKERIRNSLIDAYWYEVHEGAKDIQHFRNAFGYALHGGLNEGEYKEYIQHQAIEIVEYLFSHEDLQENSLAEVETYIPYIPPRTFRNMCTGLFLQFIRENQMDKARSLKHRFKVTFGRGEYDEENKVLEYFMHLTETRGQFDLPKGEENLKTAIEVGELFELNKKELDEVAFLLFKHYVTKKHYAQARKFYVPGRKELLEFIENECQKLISKKQSRDALILVQKLNIQFPDAYIREQRAYLKELVNNQALSKDDFVRAVITEQMYDLNVIPDYIYQQFIKDCFQSPHIGTQLMVDLSQALIPRFSSCLRIRLHEHIQEMHVGNAQLAEELQKAFKPILPPTILDYFFCFLLKFLHWD